MKRAVYELPVGNVNVGLAETGPFAAASAAIVSVVLQPNRIFQDHPGVIETTLVFKVVPVAEPQ